ncbi:ATP-dependent Clp protease adapter ClpS [Okeania hirsuta]|uniref:ATP-dependent Clp protease adapter ClpS n=1 Tax=Okeania hirsuta TaxID=1458930 RepID=A0A3N6P1A4_9CYAN|nr:ATP-dependent Clp protease adapter ClpS [Okeania hirsuta]RQH27413.1 ATP-dependent Clp protease adapter ClpS [Okeania hirsuta]
MDLGISIIPIADNIIVGVGGSSSTTVAPRQFSQVVNKPYPNYKVIVLNDDVNTFKHVAECLQKYIPGMTSDLAWELTHQVHNEGQAIVWVGPLWELTHQVHNEGQAIVWVGPLEQAELYHQQLSRAGLTMAPLEKA